MDAAWSLRFAATARALGEAARASGLVAPTFRSPPRLGGRLRTIRRHTGGSATVSVVVRGRPWSAVVADMIDGFVTANPGADAGSVRDALWAVVEEIDLREPRGSPPDTVRSAA